MSYRAKSRKPYGSLNRAKRVHSARSKRARHIDEGLKAPLAESVKQWENVPNRYDLPSVDTPKLRFKKKGLIRNEPESSRDSDCPFNISLARMIMWSVWCVSASFAINA